MKQDRFRLYDLTDTGLGVRDGFGNERFAIPLPRHAELVSASSYLVMLNLFQHLKVSLSYFVMLNLFQHLNTGP